MAAVRHTNETRHATAPEVVEDLKTTDVLDDLFAGIGSVDSSGSMLWECRSASFLITTSRDLSKHRWNLRSSDRSTRSADGLRSTARSSMRGASPSEHRD